MGMACKKCVASELHKSHGQDRLTAKTADSQSCQDFAACVGLTAERVFASPGLCSPFKSVHAGVASRKLVDFFKCRLRENAAGEAEGNMSPLRKTY